VKKENNGKLKAQSGTASERNRGMVFAGRANNLAVRPFSQFFFLMYKKAE